MFYMLVNVARYNFISQHNFKYRRQENLAIKIPLSVDIYVFDNAI